MTHRYPNESASSSSTSMSSSQKSETDDDRMIAMVLTEEYAQLDGAMAKRLTNLTSIPHVPRVNTYFPTYNDATTDHYRLLDRLNAYGLCEVRVSGDGNCQFRALSDQLYRSPEYHKHVRKDIVKQLKERKSLYEGYVPMKYKHYCKKMKKSGEWGDHVTLQAAADRVSCLSTQLCFDHYFISLIFIHSNILLIFTVQTFRIAHAHTSMPLHTCATQLLRKNDVALQICLTNTSLGRSTGCFSIHARDLLLLWKLDPLMVPWLFFCVPPGGHLCDFLPYSSEAMALVLAASSLQHHIQH
ncbi:hypothetical protein PR202_ga20467 [Eleusine coracana subsp. coracana]|uniref:OTU domain-containing protein n=1 Tax=Eleusine coracana subsp. coracana TaxID=191504 RepID=A0AAV5CYA9_ELECO|nr:hypothetical protein PR202_ga20467 [Eleusine coracana subsp. coracana]